MKLNMIKIVNFKSVGETDNILTIEKINTIIGKNESGKTNIIEAISGIDLTGISNLKFFENKNKINRKKPYFELELEPYKTELKEFNKLEKMYICIKSNYDIEYSGGFDNYINNDKKFNEAKARIKEILAESKLNFSDMNATNKFSDLIKSIDNAGTNIFIHYDYIDNLITRIRNSVYNYRNELVENILYCIDFLTSFYKFFPTFFVVTNDTLKSSYTMEQINKSEDIEMLENLLLVADIPIDLIKELWTEPDVAGRTQIEKEINRLLNKNVSLPFNEFYSQEKIDFSLRVEENEIKFLLSTTDTNLSYSERSDGLKWYFNLFIKMRATDLDYRNVIYIMDEPGVKLHVNAQKELIELFYELSTNDNQIIYTTHSPFMINDNFNTLRPIIKDEEGYTKIYNKYNSIPDSPSKLETLTPIFYTMGFDYRFNIGPSITKVNIVTEGISDANYLNAYFYQKKLKKSDKPNVIPSIGVSNIDKIVSILIGWGCKYFILLDNDKQGRDEYKELLEKLCVPVENICFTDGTNFLNNKIDHTIENVFSDKDYNNYINKEDYSNFKSDYSKKFMNSVLNDEVKMDNQTISNFDKIYEIIKNN